MTTPSSSRWAPYAIAAVLLLLCSIQAIRIVTLKGQIASQDLELTLLRNSQEMAGLRLTNLEARDPANAAAKIIIAWDPFQHRGVITAQNLPTPPTGQNYQLWVLDPGAQSPISAGLLHPEKQSEFFQVRSLSMPNPGFAISLEPEKGSPHPTSTILFAVAPRQ